MDDKQKQLEEAWRTLTEAINENPILAPTVEIFPEYLPVKKVFGFTSRNPQLRKNHNLFPEMRSGMPVSRRKRDR